MRELKPVVESQATDVQAMIVLNMPDPMREEYLKYGFKRKKNRAKVAKSRSS